MQGAGESRPDLESFVEHCVEVDTDQAREFERVRGDDCRPPVEEVAECGLVAGEGIEGVGIDDHRASKCGQPRSDARARLLARAEPGPISRTSGHVIGSRSATLPCQSTAVAAGTSDCTAGRLA